MRICRVRKRAIIIFATRVGRIMMLPEEHGKIFIRDIALLFFFFCQIIAYTYMIICRRSKFG